MFIMYVDHVAISKYIFSSCKRGTPLRLSKLESPKPKDICFEPLSRRFGRKRFFDFVDVFLLFNYYPVRKKPGLSF